MSMLERIYRLAVLGRLKDAPGPVDLDGVRRILVVRNDNIGDVICTTPALDALREAFPKAHIAALVCTLAQEAIEGHRALDKVYAYPKAKHRQYGAVESLVRLGKVIAQVRKERFDLVLAFRASFSSSQGWLAYASRGKWRVGPRAEGKRKRWGFYYNIPVDPPPGGVHEVLRCFHLLQCLRLDTRPKSLYLELPAQARHTADGFLAEHGLDARPGPVVLNITRWAYRPDRAWPEGRYRELARELAGLGKGLAVTCAPNDRQWVTGLLKGLDPAPAVFWSERLKEFAALAARAGAFITAEGGPMHLAAAVGAPLVVLWGKTPLEIWRPWQARHSIVGGGGPVSDITVQQVLEALGGIMNNKPGGTAEARETR